MKTKYTFWELLNEFHIEIPKIQRDYAQGRKEKYIEKITDKFLRDLRHAIVNEKQLKLDFVYGRVENEILIPLDGQQRLTTLFLIHWYLALKENKLTTDIKAILSKFTYETRISSQDFCKKLVSENIEFQSINSKISDKIVNENWYYLSWERDPTVISMLNMLDKIHNSFNSIGNVFHKLISSDIITFQFLPLEEFKLSDELYIKMNARGLPLTEFENFKANFSGYLKTVEDKSKLDNQWLDIFWEIEKKENTEIEVKEVDSKYFEFFKNITLNFYSENNKFNKNFIDNYDLFEIYTSVYNNKNYVDYVVKILDALTEYTDNEDIFRKFISRKVNYWERLRFYSLSHFFIKYGAINNDNKSIFKRWLRVTKNLINNTLIQSVDNYQDAISSIKKLSKHIENIYDYISSSPDTIEYFLSIQRKEECLKAKLIIENPEWEKLFIEIEQHQYFDGQIGFILEYIKNGNDNYDKELFKKFSKILSKLFSNEFKENYNFLFQRALLTKGNYLVDIGQNKTFCVFEDALRTKLDNWRKVFNDNKKAEYLKELIIVINENNIKESLGNIVKKHTVMDWRKLIIDNPNFIAYCSFRQIRKYSNKIYILSKIQMNGMHRELHSYDLYKRTFEDKKFPPFLYISYEESKSSDEPFICISNFSFNDNLFDLNIEYSHNNKYYLKFYIRKKYEYYWGYYYSSEIPDKLMEILKKYNFDSNSILLEEDKLELLIKNICIELKDISKK